MLLTGPLRLLGVFVDPHPNRSPRLPDHRVTNNTIESFLNTVRTVLNYPLLTLGESSLTLAIILKLLLLFALVLVAETLLRRHLAMRLLQRTSLDAPLRYGIARIGGYLFIPLGFYAAPRRITFSRAAEWRAAARSPSSRRARNRPDRARKLRPKSAAHSCEWSATNR